MTWEFRLVHKDGEWSFGDWPDVHISPWLVLNDRDWATLGRRNYEAVLAAQKSLRDDIKMKRIEVQIVLSALVRLQKVEKERPGVMRDLSKTLGYVCPEQMAGFRYLQAVVEGGNHNLYTYEKRTHGEDLESLFHAYAEQISRLDTVIEDLEAMEGLFEVELDEEPPVLPFLREEKMYEVGTEVIVWLNRDPNKDARLVYGERCCPYLVKVMCLFKDSITVESRYAPEEIDFDGTWVMLKEEYDYYLNHADYREFLLARIRHFATFRERLQVIGDIAARQSAGAV